MRKLALIIATALVAALAATTTSAAGAPATPYGMESNPLGSTHWLPANANETTPAGVNRLVVVYDHSIDEATGDPIDLLAKGPFGVKFFTPLPDPRLVGHSSSVTSLDDLGFPGEVDTAFMGVAGDVRDGDCAKAGTEAFSAAYSTTRGFFHPGEAAYEPVSGPGTCEVVDDSQAVTDEAGTVIGYNTTVTNHVPGFWIDITWPTHDVSVPVFGSLSSGYLAGELWYGSLFDTGGEDGEWYAVGDTTGQSTSIGGPGDYDAVYSFTANPGGLGPSCTAYPGVPDVEDTFDEVKVEVPADATKVSFRLFPKSDWDLVVVSPGGVKKVSGDSGGFDEQVIAPAAGTANFPELVPGEYVMRACNFTGETTVVGGVIIE